jgi:hypothetical protein
MCCADHASAPDSAHERAYSTSRSKARDEVRTRSTGVISFSTVRIGFTRSVEPIQALAAPIRPPRFRNSSVSMANQSRSSLRASATCAATSLAEAPSRAAFAAASTMKPSPPAAVVESTTSMRSPPLPSRVSASFAWRAASGVPDRPPEMWTETTSPPPARSGSKTELKSPTDGCEVVGSFSAPRSSSKKAG